MILFLFYIKGCVSMIINIAHTKGGVGKSTLATNLAVEMNCPILDLDMQKSSYFFNELRELPKLTIFKAKTRDELKLLEPYAGDKKKHIIVDSGGMDNDLNRLSLVYADLILTPISTSQIELFGLENFRLILKELDAENKDYIILNSINLRSKQELQAFNDILINEFDLTVLPTMISNLKIFKDAFAEGKSVVEKNKTSPAAAQLQSLIKDIKNIIKSK